MISRWAKTRRVGEAQEGDAFHLLAHHGLDVAAILAVGLGERTGLLDHLASLLELGPADTRALVLGLATLHDIGKVATAFQLQDEAAATALGVRPGGGTKPYGRAHGHDLVGHVLLLRLLQTRRVAIAGERALASHLAPLWAAFSGHHGRQAHGWDWAQVVGRGQVMEEDEAVAAAFVAEAFAVHGRPAALPTRAASRRASYLLNGLVTVADWLGSDTRFFPFCAKPLPLAQYWEQHALPAAHRAVAAIGPSVFLRTRAAPALSFKALFAHLTPGASPVPTPLQAAAEALMEDGLPSGPLLIVIEDMTGAGKTEASDLITHRLISAGHADGAYMGLPTMATADAAFRRKTAIVRKLFAEEPSQVLAHSQARQRRTVRLVESRSALEAGDPAAVAWLAASSRRALLADLGVGTVDQALIGALRTPHATVRLAGLWRKVLIIDEVHAYDDYMQALLTKLLQHHAAMGGIAILLSATLPSRHRTALLTAFATGAGWSWGEDEAAKLPTHRFPLLTLASRTGPRVPEIGPGSTRAARPIRVVRAATRYQVQRRLLIWAKAGRSAVWFRNTVDDAREAWEVLREAALSQGLPEPILYHARFLPADRAAIEARVEAVAGKESQPAGRRGQIVVATQVAEQSLDLDFDELVTDLAPVDALLQRFGRRRRHARDADGTRAADAVERREDDGVVVVLAPDLDAPTPNWYCGLFPGASAVYPDDARLWRTLQLLSSPDLIPQRAVSGPLQPERDLKPLIEAVYASSDELEAATPSCLHGRHREAEGHDIQAAQVGRHARLSFVAGLLEDWTAAAVPEDAAERATTRLGDGGRVVLVERHQGRLRFLGTGEGDDVIDQSTCRCPRAIQPMPLPQEDMVQICAGLSRAGRQRLSDMTVVVLHSDHYGNWYCMSNNEKTNATYVIYNARQGLSITKL